MKSKHFFTYFALMFLFGAYSQSYAAPPGSTIVFQGQGFITALNSTCLSLGYKVGSFYTTVYRFKNASTDPSDVLALFDTRNTFYVVSAGPTGSLNGDTPTTEANISANLYFDTNIPSSTNLAISSIGGTPTASAVNLKILGTINDFFGNPGCSVCFHANLLRRPDE